MMPGMNPKMMKQAMKRMGIKQEEIEATEVIIRTPESEIVILNPQVSKVNAMGQETYQVVGEAHVREKTTEPDINADDIKTVMEQAQCDESTAKTALEEAKGDIAEAILSLQD